MKISQRALREIEREMIKQLPEVLHRLFPDAVTTETDGAYLVKFKAKDGNLYPVKIDPEGYWQEPETGLQRTLFALWMRVKNSNQFTSAVLYCVDFGKDPKATVFPPIFCDGGEGLPPGVRSMHDIMSVSVEDDTTSLIGYENRFLGLRGSLVVIGPSGVGKSSLALHLASHLAAGEDWFGIKMRRALNVMMVQRENDDGDLKEMIEGANKDRQIDDQVSRRIERRLVFWCPEVRGKAFCEYLQDKILQMGIDVVIIDPLLACIDGDISSQETVAGFLRLQLQPVLDRTNAVAIILHHTGKPGEGGAGAKRGRLESSYSGIGSSEITNWARAIAVISPAGKNYGTFRFEIVKRCRRSGLKSRFTGEPDQIFLKHSSQGISWTEVGQPDEPKKQSKDKTKKEDPSGSQSQVALDIIEEAGGEILRSDLIQKLMETLGVSSRTVSTFFGRLTEKKLIHISRTEPRKGGGRALRWIRAGKQSETN